MSHGRASADSEKTLTQINPKARAIGSIFSGLLESMFASPWDKYKNNSMLNPEELKGNNSKERMLKTLIGPNYRDMGLWQRVNYCYRGFTPYCLHKMINRGLKLGFQTPLMESLMRTQYYDSLKRKIGKDNAKIAASTVSGIGVGLLEVVANPVDRAKLLCQRKNISIWSALSIMKEEGLAPQYKGWRPTAVRNASGSGALFFGRALGQQITGVVDHNNLTFLQSITSSMIGSAFSIVVSHVPDVIKVREQLQAGPRIPMRHTIFKMVQEEGVQSLCRGLVPKLISSGGKLTIVVSLCDMLVAAINQQFQSEQDQPKLSLKR